MRQVSRSRAALLAVVFGVVSMIVATGFIDWNLRFGRENTIRSQLGHIQIVKRGFLEAGTADPFAYLLNPADPALQRLDRVGSLVTIAPRLQVAGLASSGDITLSFIGEGVDPVAEAEMSSALRFPLGRNLRHESEQEAVIGRGLADNLGIELGKPLVLIVTTESGGVNAVEATVVGVFESISKAYDDVALRIPITLARKLMRVEGEHIRMILLDDTARTAMAVDEITQLMNDTRHEVIPWTQLADFYNKTAALFAKQVGVIDVIIAVIIVLSISNTMTMAVMQRVGEIGTIMAMGTRRRDVLMTFVLEGTFIGVLGVLLGTLLGVVLALILSAIGIPMPPGPGMTWGYDAGILLSTGALVKAASIAFLTTLVASLIPAWKASRLDIVTALRALQ